jgi:4-amino-4-deoxy-L-arabinose transferase-like glycosyltransferase
MTERASKSRLGLALAIALALRLMYVGVYPQMDLCPDCTMYDEVGWHVAQGLGFVGGFGAETFERTSIRDPTLPEYGVGPAYAAFLGGVYRLVGHRPQAIRWVQAVLSTTVIVPIFLVTLWTFGQASANLAAVLTAVYPPAIFYSGMLLTESLYTVLLAWLLLAVAAVKRRPAGITWLAGAVMGTTILLRQEALTMAPCFGAIMLLPKWREHLRTVVVFAVMTGAVVSIWTVRNYVLSGRLLLVAAHSGDIVYISAKGWPNWHFDDPELQSLVRGTTYLTQNDVLGAAGMKMIRADPVGYLSVRLRSLPDFWWTSHTNYLRGFSDSFGQYTRQGRWPRVAIKAVLLIVNSALIIVGLMGLWRSARERRGGAGAWILAVPIVITAGVHFWLYTSPRYAIPIMPALFAFIPVVLIGTNPRTS